MNSQENADAYAIMATVVRAEFERLLSPLEKIRNPAQLLESTTAELFFQNFLIQAVGFIEKTSQQFAKTLRQFSIVPEVRGTPTTELAKKIRETCFESVDKVLTSYIHALKDLNLDFSTVNIQIAESSAIGAALHGAAVGQLAGGLGRAGKTIGTFNAIWQGADQLVKQGLLAEQQRALFNRAKRLPYEKIAAFLEGAAVLPEELLDYGCARCFGAQVDFARQRQALELVSSATSKKLKEAITLVRNLPTVEEELMQKKAEIEAVKVKEEKRLKSKKDNAGCLVGLGVLALIVGWGVFVQEEGIIDWNPAIVGTAIAAVFLIAAAAVAMSGRRRENGNAAATPTPKITKPVATTSPRQDDDSQYMPKG